VLRRPLERDVTVDVFDAPERAAFRERVVARRRAGLTEKQVATELGITVTAAQCAAALQRHGAIEYRRPVHRGIKPAGRSGKDAKASTSRLPF
jgi:hypothetical protein